MKLNFLAVIIKKKRNRLISEVLDMIYSNPMNFPENRRELKNTENGVFIYDYPLPTETALECSDCDL